MKSKQNETPWEDAILIVEKFWNTIALASEPSSINYWCSRWDRDVCGRGCWWWEGWVEARGESFFRPNRGVKVSSGDVDVPVSEEGVRFVSKWPHGNGRSPKVARSLRPRTIANASETATMLNVANCALFSHVIKSRIKETVRPVIVHPSLGVVNAARTAASIDDRVASCRPDRCDAPEVSHSHRGRRLNPPGQDFCWENVQRGFWYFWTNITVIYALSSNKFSTHYESCRQYSSPEIQIFWYSQRDFLAEILYSHCYNVYFKSIFINDNLSI